MATKLAVGSLLIPRIAHRGLLNEETLYSDQASSSSTSLGIPFDFREAFTFSRRSFSRSSVAVSVGDRSYSRATCSAYDLAHARQTWISCGKDVGNTFADRIMNHYPPQHACLPRPGECSV